MAFSETLKSAVKEQAGYQCCLCHRPFDIDVHHITPIKEGGSDDIDNAVPLCPNCHRTYGNDPMKRTAIKEVREYWYKKVKEMHGAPVVPSQTLEELNETIRKWNQGLSDFEEVKSMLKRAAETAINTVSPSTASEAITGVMHLTMPMPTFRGTGRANVVTCKGCGNLVDPDNYCPKCGGKL